ncbi:hypothetical protein PRK78_006782 [Emydomyces testavorans]|uniref:Uncharacterized protein n=1 Tax=Emydomyces testavorans TaxID=2070801 RepID=A0AAF0DMG1_9EURO|nr:hypothetical protein PRK78_006782 [Emydomyces testavorans]
MAFHANPTPLPPTSLLSTRRIPTSTAHAFLAAYLERAATDPSHQPDSTLSAHGPVAANTGATPNLVLHNLKRVQAGLRGEVLGRDVVLEQQQQLQREERDGMEGLKKKQGKKTTMMGMGMGKGGGATAAAAGAGDAGKLDDGWQDLESFEREQVDLVQGGDDDGDDGGNFGATAVEGDMGVEDDVKEAVMNKEERKRKKKERRKAEQRAKASAAS